MNQKLILLFNIYIQLCIANQFPCQYGFCDQLQPTTTEINRLPLRNDAFSMFQNGHNSFENFYKNLPQFKPTGRIQSLPQVQPFSSEQRNQQQRDPVASSSIYSQTRVSLNQNTNFPKFTSNQIRPGENIFEINNRANGIIQENNYEDDKEEVQNICTQNASKFEFNADYSRQNDNELRKLANDFNMRLEKKNTSGLLPCPAQCFIVDGEGKRIYRYKIEVYKNIPSHKACPMKCIDKTTKVVVTLKFNYSP
ncbi:hypothetical protein PVAND_017132 [Polypedilum vanderplanki]|uniref:Uncharacterized protein n=1 Tax=Polypedilum vanderplanki TaxID=319348 RepID=A0A9J6BHU8_POLVA|nr:hypothetical protein PVAND_017132 [Polypedilum vanderplanki]